MFAELRAVAARRQAELRPAQTHAPPLSPVNARATAVPLPAPATDAQETKTTERTPTVPVTHPMATLTPCQSETSAQLNKYKRMLRVGIHMNSVLRKMGEDAFDIALFDLETDPAAVQACYQPAFDAATHHVTAGAVPTGSAPPTLVRKKIHLSMITKSKTTLRIASEDCGTTLWSCDHVEFANVCVSNETRAEFDALFTKSVATTKTTATSTNGKASASMASSSSLSRGTALIDKGRAQNIAILLVGMKLSTDEWRECVLRMTFKEHLSENLKMLLLAWPTSDEERAIQAYDGDSKKLGRAEGFLVGLRDIPRVKEKIESLRFRLLFSTRVFELRESMLLVVRAIHQIMENKSFGAAMQHVFRLCCVLNDGDDASQSDTRTGAKGLRMSALTQLLCARSFDPAVSVLGAIARAIERDAPQLGRFTRELTLLTKCAAVSVEALRSELASLEGGYAELCRESTNAATIHLAATTNPQLMEDLRGYHAIVNSFAAEAELELRGLRMNLRDLQDAGARLNAYLEESDTTPFHEIITHIAAFVEAYAAERAKILPTAREDEEVASNPRSPRSTISDDEFLSPPSSMTSTSTSTLTPCGSDGGKEEA